MRGTFTVRGRKVRTDSQRRFVVWQIWGETDAAIWKRTDSIQTARQEARNCRSEAVIIDTTTGQEVTG